MLLDATWPWVSALPPGILGLNGPQGCGKSTLAAALVARAAAEGRRWVAWSIDDLYWPRVVQAQLTAAHPDEPLLAVRGGPGTHDVDLGARILDALRAPTGTVALPVYDKAAHGGLGDRAAETRPVQLPVERVILEGWMLGFPSVGGGLPIDPRFAAYEAWTSRLDALLHLRVADPEQIVRWRVEAEQRMRAVRGAGMTDAQAEAYIRRFLPIYELYPRALAERDLGIPRREVWLDAARRPVR